MRLPGLKSLRPKSPRLKSPRLLPIVIFAAVALLAFKGVGLLTNGGYVLSGTQPALAADAAPAASGSTPAATSGDADEPTLADTSPTLTDTAPTFGAAAPPPAGPPSPSSAPAAPPPAPAVVAAASARAPAIPAPGPTQAVAPAPATAAACASGAAAGATGAASTNCPSAPTSANVGDAGTPTCAPSATEQAVLDRLSQRRQDLDKQAAALGLRETLVKAAEQQMQDRADALKALQQQIADLQSQKKSMEDANFAGIVKMYETMKPQEAASIFDGLDMDVLIRVAQAMDARKMSPILAKMVSTRAQQLTMQLADANQESANGTAAADPNALPQIVGQ